MIWIILFGIVIISGLAFIVETDGASLLGVAVGSLVISLIVCNGLTLYPDLCKDKEEVLSLHQEIESMRGAHYSQVSSGQLVGGSLDNFKQSSALSDYIKRYANKKAKFNGKLTSIKIKISSSSYWWFTYVCFVDKRVNEIEKIK